VNYDEFVSAVQEHARFRHRGEAEASVTSVFRAMAEVLPQARVEGLASFLPPELMVYLRGAHEEPDPFFDEHLFLGWVVTSIDTTGARDKTVGGLDLYAAFSGDEAIRRCEAVFSVLKPLLDEDHRQLLHDCLPETISGLLDRA
jgi:uncharacterized protein (DUF2267 family)